MIYKKVRLVLNISALIFFYSQFVAMKKIESASRNTFSVLFFLNRVKQNNNKEHPVYCRLTVNGKIREMSTQIWIDEKIWNPKTHKVLGNNERSKTFNNTLESINNKLLNIRNELQNKGKLVTAELVVNLYKGKGEKQKTLVEVHDFYNESYVKPLIDKSYSKGTYERYLTSLSHVKDFLKYQGLQSNISLSEISYSFATTYELYLKTVRKCANNTTVKYVKNLKTILNYAVEREWLQYNPLLRYKAKLERVERDYLTEEEIHLITKLNIDIYRTNCVRDVFLFCCYTGLSYSDVAKLKSENIVRQIDGHQIITIKRTKTGVITKVPLLDPAIDILSKYKNNEECLAAGKLLPVKSNQKHNAYLKEIADLCGIKKELTTHIARHTFATLMLTKGVSLETVSSMLGHSSIKTTQIYAKIITEKLSKEMKKVNAALLKAI